MNIVMEGHGCKTSIEQVLMLFFPLSDDITIYSEYYEDGEESVIVTKLRYNLQEASTTYRDIICREDPLRVRNFVKKGTFLTAKKLSDQSPPWGILTGIRPAKIATDLMAEGESDDDIRKLLKEECWVTDEKIDLTMSVAKKEFPILSQVKEKTVGLYIGMPFCPTRCLYCSFVSTSMEYLGKYLKPYLKCLEQEIKKTAEILNELDFTVDTVYFGGGTPTTISSDQMDELLNHLCSTIDLSMIREFTIEAGRPDTLSREKLRVLKRYPVTRLSINPQSMHQVTLDRIGRKHTPEDIVRAYEMAREEGFADINSDVIAGLPGETPAMFSETLNKLKRLEPEGITVHTMYIKRASRLREEIQNYRLTTPETVGEMLDISQRFMKEHGYKPYYMYKQKNTLGNHENIGFAKPGHESIYNILMMEEAQTIIGMGGGGVTKIVRHGKIDRIFNMKNADEYVNRIDEMLERKDQILDFYR